MLKIYECINSEKYGTKPTRLIYGIQFTDGLAYVDRYHDSRFFDQHADFKEVQVGDGIVRPQNLKRVLLKIPGGIGDTLFATPLIRGIKETHGQDCSIEILGNRSSMPVLQNHPDISTFHHDPLMHFDKIQHEYDDVFDLGGTIENNPVAEFENAYKVTCDTFGIKPSSYLPVSYPMESELDHARDLMNQWRG